MSDFRLAASCGAVAMGLCFALGACATTAADLGQAAVRIDSLLSQEYPQREPGAAVLVSKAGTVILKNAVILLSNRTPGRPRCGGLAVRVAAIAAGG